MYFLCLEGGKFVAIFSFSNKISTMQVSTKILEKIFLNLGRPVFFCFSMNNTKKNVFFKI